MLELRQTLQEIEGALIAADPNEIANGDGGLQERKSAQTRVSILNATIHCLRQWGYAQTSTQLVAEKAEISRGAILHHYTTKADLIEAIIDYIEVQRLRTYISEIRALSDSERILEGKAMEIYWQLLKTPQSEAYMELQMASHTDEELRKLFLPKARRHDKMLLSVLPGIFPEWQATSIEDLQVAHDAVNAMLAGLSLNYDILTTKKRRVAVRQFMHRAVHMLRSRQ